MNYTTQVRLVKENIDWCQSSLKMSPFLPRLKCPLGGLGRAWRGGCWSGAWHRVFGGAGGRRGSAHRASGGDRALEHRPPPASDGFLRPTLVGVLLVGLRAWARVRHVDRLLLRNAARTLRSGNFFPGQALAAIPHFQSSVGGLVDQRFASRAVTAARRPQLQRTSVVAHHPVVAHRTLRLQAEDGVQLRGTRFWPVVVFRARRGLRKALVQRGKIFGLQIGIGGFVGVDVLAPEFFDQAVLVPTLACPPAPV